MSDIKILRVDSTTSNTGYKDGCLQWLEELCHTTFHWCICTCHLLELPLRKLVQVTVGETAGPGSFKGQLGKSIQSVTHVPTPISFGRIDCDDFPKFEGTF